MALLQGDVAIEDSIEMFLGMRHFRLVAEMDIGTPTQTTRRTFNIPCPDKTNHHQPQKLSLKVCNLERPPVSQEEPAFLHLGFIYSRRVAVSDGFTDKSAFPTSNV